LRRAYHTKLYQKEDLIDLMERQSKQSDNRLSREELDIARHALTFGDKLVCDYMTPRSQMISVAANEKVGPVLMDTLHKSGHTRFPVYDTKPGNVIATLYMHDLVADKSGGIVKDIAKPAVFYAHDSQTLYQTLMAFLKTKHHLFIVVNSFEEIVGIITLEDVLEQILGRPILDEFDQYEDLRAVATSAATKIHKEQKHEETVPPASKE
jgi:CBS domain containing-hemolysin-like protein